MNLKLFYSPPKWLAFEAPEKPGMDRAGAITFLSMYGITQWEDEWNRYDKAYSEAKANALEVGNEEAIMQKFYGSTSTLSDGVEFDWPGSAVIKDGKYILEI